MLEISYHVYGRTPGITRKRRRNLRSALGLGHLGCLTAVGTDHLDGNAHALSLGHREQQRGFCRGAGRRAAAGADPVPAEHVTTRMVEVSPVEPHVILALTGDDHGRGARRRGPDGAGTAAGPPA